MTLTKPATSHVVHCGVSMAVFLSERMRVGVVFVCACVVFVLSVVEGPTVVCPIHVLQQEYVQDVSVP